MVADDLVSRSDRTLRAITQNQDFSQISRDIELGPAYRKRAGVNATTHVATVVATSDSIRGG